MYQTSHSDLCRQYAADRRATLEHQARVARLTRHARAARRQQRRSHR